MRRYSLTYFIGQSIKSLWRNGVMSTASIMVLMSCLVVLGSFSLLLYNINENLDNLGILNEIVVHIDDEKTEAEVQAIYEQVLALENVAEVEHITKAQIFSEEREEFAKLDALFALIEQNNDNPYPDTFYVTYSDNAAVENLEYQLAHIDGVQSVSSRMEVADQLENIKSGIVLIFVWFLIVLFIVSIFVIINTIKLAVFSRRQEISIMRYVGATNWFITLPFIFEGVIMGVLSSGIAFLLQWYSYNYICKMITSDYSMITIIAFDDVKMIVLAGFAIIGVITGVIGSVISLSKYMKA